MTIANTTVVNTTSKYIVRSKGVGSETDQVMVDAEQLTNGTNKSLVSLTRRIFLSPFERKLKVKILQIYINHL